MNNHRCSLCDFSSEDSRGIVRSCRIVPGYLHNPAFDCIEFRPDQARLEHWILGKKYLKMSAIDKLMQKYS